MSTTDQLIDLIIGHAPELQGIRPTEEALERARQVVTERTPTVKGDSVAFAALVDLVVHELTHDRPKEG